MLQTIDRSLFSTMKGILIFGLFTLSNVTSGQTADKTGLQIHYITGLSEYEEELKTFTQGIAPKLVEIVNSEYFHYALLHTPMEGVRHYRKGPVTYEQMLNALLKAEEDRSDEYCRTAGLEEMDVFETKDRVIDIAIEFISAEEMSARNWSTMTAAFAPLGCPYIRVAKKHFIRYYQYDQEIFAISTLLHEYMHTQYFNHVSRAVNRKDVPYSVEDIANSTYRWLRLLEEQPEVLGRWEWRYSINEGDTLNTAPNSDSYTFELTPQGQFILKINGQVNKEEIARICYLNAEKGTYRFRNFLSDTNESGIDFTFDEQGLTTDYFPQPSGTINFFQKVK